MVFDVRIPGKGMNGVWCKDTRKGNEWCLM